MSPRPRRISHDLNEPVAHAFLVRSTRLWVVGYLLMSICSSGCGLFNGGQQVKQLQSENDRLLAEYRAQRDRLAKLQETNAALESRVGEAEKLLARSGQTLPSSRLSRATNKASPPSSAPATSSGSSPPPYIPPSVPSIPASAATSDPNAPVKWRPMRRPLAGD